MADEAQQLTLGQKYVGLSFNPSGDPDVTKVKQLFAEIIDIMHAKRQTVGGHHAEDAGGDGEASRLYSIAITKAQDAQMWAVKGLTWSLSGQGTTPTADSTDTTPSASAAAPSAAQTTGSDAPASGGSGSSGTASGA